MLRFSTHKARDELYVFAWVAFKTAAQLVGVNTMYKVKGRGRGYLQKLDNIKRALATCIRHDP